ncbi:2-isopropylmalate synthase (Alpha-isopropylmalate synthase) (Alpha-IPM synthetase) [Dimargaris cristalligena]|uniref:2-isopropylmalate synthase n=1 Tax=Dimargaris cristalligena TaxID=215637 RepID=A0A4P9ZR96_9FUNG|nr:2-isopropylmalate synthase (Alpha-isopropylmalate synthase) (Alpha-IPM synthetase) [Dimargaris cristalligena]RKP35963.1 pyruvate carboxyltransferase [Dimargaris cristalligena]|eukprot:RKP35963.1 pyruvate carboxyltransferase [Dimargaris cristalligena]
MSAINADPKLILFSDTTLRDGEQAPGVHFTADSKVEIAKGLAELGVDIIEVGFPVSSEQNFDTCRRIAREVGHHMTHREHIGQPVMICALCRTMESDILRTYEAIKDAPRFQIRLFIATSNIHLEHKLRISRTECLRRVREGIRLARTLSPNVAFGAEDGGRTDPDFLTEVFGVAIEEGATLSLIGDTVGGCIPAEFHQLVKYCVERTPGSKKTIWGVHTHNDLGLGVANTLAGIEAGATLVDATMLGMGERAGNAALEEVAMCLSTHAAHYHATHQLNTPHFTRVCRMVAARSGMILAANKPIIGQNVFRHTSGIHQDGMLKNRSTYEYLNPNDVGATSDALILSAQSGRTALLSRLGLLGYTGIPNDQFQLLFAKFKNLAQTKLEVDDADLVKLMSD